MIVENLEALYRARALNRQGKPSHWNRASSMGYCPRRLGYDKLGVIGEPLTPRRLSIFDDGNFYDQRLKDDICVALAGKAISLDGLGLHSVEIEGVEITYTPDFAFQTEDGKVALGEIKSMSNFAFERACKGEIDIAYLCQAWTYHYGTSFNPIVFICVRKETRHICEVVFDADCKERVIVERYGGNLLELAKNDPMLIAEVKSPFDESVEERVRRTIRDVSAAESLATLPIGVNAIEKEIVKIQGKAKAEEAKAQYGEPESVSGSWFAFWTGRWIAGFPCSYCPHIRGCLGADLEIKDGIPAWVVPDGK